MTSREPIACDALTSTIINSRDSQLLMQTVLPAPLPFWDANCTSRHLKTVRKYMGTED